MNKPKILLVNKNKQTGNPTSHGYNAYDFSFQPDKYIRASIFGKVVQAKKTETRNWLANTSTDPYKPATGKRKLKTADYGNYCKIKGEIDGETIYEITSHHKANTLTVQKGQEVKPGQIIAEVGDTGNSTGRHEHKEFRDVDERAIEVEFVKEQESHNENTEEKQKHIDAGLITRPDRPYNDDELNSLKQRGINNVEAGRSTLQGDEHAREYWLKQWDIKQADTNWQEIARSYQDTFERLKQIYGLSSADNTEEVLGFATRSQERIKELEKELEPKIVYKHEGKDYEKLFSFMNLILIQEKG